MRVLFVARFIGTYSVHRAQIELISALQNKIDHFLLLGKFSDEIKNILQKHHINFVEQTPTKKIDAHFISDFKETVTEFNPKIVHVIHGAFLRNINIALKNHPAKLITYFGSASLYWHDFSSYFTYLSPRVDNIICNSQYVYNHVKKQLFGKAKNKATKIYKGYNPNWFTHVIPFDYAELNIPQNAIIVALAATHTKNKRIQDFINSSHYLQSNKEIHYIIFGHGTTNNDLVALKEKSPIKNNIHLLGLRNDAVSLLKGADIYVQTSLSEGFGRAVSEALCVGKPVIMTNCGGGTELIDENSGIIVPKKDVKAIANAITKLADNDILRKKMGDNAKNRIANTYHINQTINNTLELYKSLV